MRRAVTFLALAVIVSCSKATQGTGTSTGARGASNLITRQEIATIPATDGYDAVQRLRPEFLRPRSTASRTTAYAVVFVDGINKGAPEALRLLRSPEIAEIRFLSAVDATTRYGLNVPAGVIQVTLITR